MAPARARVTMPVERFEVAEAGAYRLPLALEDDVGAHFRSARVVVRRNVRVLDGGLVGALAAGGVFGLGLALGASALHARRGAARRAARGAAG